MTIIVEDGSNVEGANSYCGVADADAYHSTRGNATWTETSTSPDQGKAAALIRATAAIDAKYSGRWPGYRTNGRNQELDWPRTAAYDIEGNPISGSEIPQEVIDATCEAALRELASAGSMLPDLDRGGQIRSLAAGSVRIEYGSNAAAQTSYQLIDGILSPILVPGSGGGLFGVAVRG